MLWLKGYHAKRFVLPDLNKYKKDEKITIFHSGTKLLNNKIISDGEEFKTALGEAVSRNIEFLLNELATAFEKDIGKIIE